MQCPRKITGTRCSSTLHQYVSLHRPSQDGLGFVLTQEGQQVTSANRALTPAEQRYSQIEKELLAQVFGLEYYPHYTFGR